METRKQKGYLLIEVLIAITLLTVGVTGLTSVQLIALRLNHDAQLVSDVSMLNRAILQKLRSHPELFTHGSFNLQMHTNPSDTPRFDDLPIINNIVQGLWRTGANFRIEIECETGDFTICEVCFQDDASPSTNLLSTANFDSNSSCNRQIVM